MSQKDPTDAKRSHIKDVYDIFRDIYEEFHAELDDRIIRTHSVEDIAGIYANRYGDFEKFVKEVSATPFVGFDNELQEATAFLQSGCDRGENKCMLIIGEHGAGKTAFLSKAVAQYLSTKLTKDDENSNESCLVLHLDGRMLHDDLSSARELARQLSISFEKESLLSFFNAENELGKLDDLSKLKKSAALAPSPALALPSHSPTRGPFSDVTEDSDDESPIGEDSLSEAPKPSKEDVSATPTRSLTDSNRPSPSSSPSSTPPSAPVPAPPPPIARLGMQAGPLASLRRSLLQKKDSIMAEVLASPARSFRAREIAASSNVSSDQQSSDSDNDKEDTTERTSVETSNGNPKPMTLSPSTTNTASGKGKQSAKAMKATVWNTYPNVNALTGPKLKQYADFVLNQSPELFRVLTAPGGLLDIPPPPPLMTTTTVEAQPMQTNSTSGVADSNAMDSTSMHDTTSSNGQNDDSAKASPSFATRKRSRSEADEGVEATEPESSPGQENENSNEMELDSKRDSADVIEEKLDADSDTPSDPKDAANTSEVDQKESGTEEATANPNGTVKGTPNQSSDQSATEEEPQTPPPPVKRGRGRPRIYPVGHVYKYPKKEKPKKLNLPMSHPFHPANRHSVRSQLRRRNLAAAAGVGGFGAAGSSGAVGAEVGGVGGVSGVPVELGVSMATYFQGVVSPIHLTSNPFEIATIRVPISDRTNHGANGSVSLQRHLSSVPQTVVVQGSPLAKVQPESDITSEPTVADAAIESTQSSTNLFQGNNIVSSDDQLRGVVGGYILGQALLPLASRPSLLPLKASTVKSSTKVEDEPATPLLQQAILSGLPRVPLSHDIAISTSTSASYATTTTTADITSAPQIKRVRFTPQVLQHASSAAFSASRSISYLNHATTTTSYTRYYSSRDVSLESCAALDKLSEPLHAEVPPPPLSALPFLNVGTTNANTAASPSSTGIATTIATSLASAIPATPSRRQELADIAIPSFADTDPTSISTPLPISVSISKFADDPSALLASPRSNTAPAPANIVTGATNAITTDVPRDLTATATAAAPSDTADWLGLSTLAKASPTFEDYLEYILSIFVRMQSNPLTSKDAILYGNDTMIDELSSEHGSESKSKSSIPVILCLDNFDAYAQKTKQSLLYSLFDLLQAKSAHLTILATSSSLDVLELLEKRVRSRFTAKKLLLPNVSIHDVRNMLSTFLSLPDSTRDDVIDEYKSTPSRKLLADQNDATSNNASALRQLRKQCRAHWNKCIRGLLGSKVTVEWAKLQIALGKTFSDLKNELIQFLSLLPLSLTLDTADIVSDFLNNHGHLLYLPPSDETEETDSFSIVLSSQFKLERYKKHTKFAERLLSQYTNEVHSEYLPLLSHFLPSPELFLCLSNSALCVYQPRVLRYLVLSGSNPFSDSSDSESTDLVVYEEETRRILEDTLDNMKFQRGQFLLECVDIPPNSAGGCKDLGTSNAILALTLPPHVKSNWILQNLLSSLSLIEVMLLVSLCHLNERFNGANIGRQFHFNRQGSVDVEQGLSLNFYRAYVMLRVFFLELAHKKTLGDIRGLNRSESVFVSEATSSKSGEEFGSQMSDSQSTIRRQGINGWSSGTGGREVLALALSTDLWTLPQDVQKSTLKKQLDIYENYTLSVIARHSNTRSTSYFTSIDLSGSPTRLHSSTISDTSSQDPNPASSSRSGTHQRPMARGLATPSRSPSSSTMSKTLGNSPASSSTILHTGPKPMAVDIAASQPESASITSTPSATPSRHSKPSQRNRLTSASDFSRDGIAKALAVDETTALNAFRTLLTLDILRLANIPIHLKSAYNKQTDSIRTMELPVNEALVTELAQARKNAYHTINPSILGNSVDPRTKKIIPRTLNLPFSDAIITKATSISNNPGSATTAIVAANKRSAGRSALAAAGAASGVSQHAKKSDTTSQFAHAPVHLVSGTYNVTADTRRAIPWAIPDAESEGLVDGLRWLPVAFAFKPEDILQIVKKKWGKDKLQPELYKWLIFGPSMTGAL